MNTKRGSGERIAGLILAISALACNLPAGMQAPTSTSTPEVVEEAAVTLSPFPTVITAPEDCTATANQPVNMRTGPGTAWPVVSQLDGGVSARVTGHNGDSTWWQLNDSAWVSAPFTTTSGDCSDIPVAGFPPPPTKEPKPSKTPGNAPTNAPTQAPTQAPQPTLMIFTLVPLTFVLPTNLAFEVDFNTVWTCGSSGRVSFQVYNQGNVNIESVYYSVEAPAGTYLNSGTVNNAPFEATATEPPPACAQAVGHGQTSLAPGQGRSVPVNLSSLPASGVEGFLYFEACTQNNRGGDCESQILYFFF
jgi:hypothetical protein